MSHPKDQRRPLRSRTRSPILTLDGLEDRSTPATLFVSPAGMDLAGRGLDPALPLRSLQFAANAAVGGDQIRVAGGTYTFTPGVPVLSAQGAATSLGTTQVLTVYEEDLQFLGGYSPDFATRNPMASPTIIDGEATHRGVLAISINAPVGMNLDGFIIQNGLAKGIPARTAEPFNAYGGGVFVDNGGAANSGRAFVLRNMTFRNNRAVGENTNADAGGNGVGGGVALRLANNTTLENVIFDGNGTQGGTGPVRGGAALGGGLHAAGSTFTGTNLTFTNNTATGGSTGGLGITGDGERGDGLGGGLALGGIPPVNIGSNATLTGVTFTSNTARGGATSNTGNSFGGGGFGGAIFTEISDLTLTNAVATANKAEAAAGGTGGIAQGGVVESNLSNVTFDRVKFVGNTATSGPSNKGGDAGPAGGGAIAASRFNTSRPSTFRLTNSLIADNTLSINATGGNGMGGGGGGVALQGINDAKIVHTTIANNAINRLVNGNALLALRTDASPATVTLAQSIVANHQGVFTFPNGMTDIPAVVVTQQSTITYDRVLFAGNLRNDNRDAAGKGGPLEPGTYNGTGSLVMAATADFTAPGPMTFDYSLKASSAAKEAGTGSSTTVDISGGNRAGVPDLGAFEFGTPGTAPVGGVTTGGAVMNPTSPPPPPPPPPGPPAGIPTLVGFPQFLVGAGSGGGPGVNLFNPDKTVRTGGFAFSDTGFTGGVRTAAADFTNDGIADLVVGTGPGRATQVRVLNGIDRAVIFEFAPFEPAFVGGVYVSAGDTNADGAPELVVTPDEGGGPRVRVFNGKGFGQVADFFGIDDPNFRGGARSAVGDVNGDGSADIVVAAGFQGGPRVAVFSGKSLGGTPVKLFNDFFAFEQTLRNGVFIATGDLDADGKAEIIAGGGPGGGPRVTAFSAKDLISSGGGTLTTLANFFGGNPDNRGGIRIAVKNLDNDNRADIVVGAGPGAGPRVTAYLGKNIGSQGTPPEQFGFDALPSDFTGGIFVG